MWSHRACQEFYALCDLFVPCTEKAAASSFCFNNQKWWKAPSTPSSNLKKRWKEIHPTTAALVLCLPPPHWHRQQKFCILHIYDLICHRATQNCTRGHINVVRKQDILKSIHHGDFNYFSTQFYLFCLFFTTLRRWPSIMCRQDVRLCGHTDTKLPGQGLAVWIPAFKLTGFFIHRLLFELGQTKSYSSLYP